MWGKRLLVTFVIFGLLVGGYVMYMRLMVNPRISEQIRTEPESAAAARAMLLIFADGREIPVNYLWEGNQVFAGADGRWWRAFRSGPTPVTLVIKGETYAGQATVELNDQSYVDDVFSRLRPTAPEWLPDWANGKLVIVTLDEQ
ncbi:MAG: hypothetical protein ACR2PZ_16185 [Pseudomonadales bacterium]